MQIKEMKRRKYAMVYLFDSLPARTVRNYIILRQYGKQYINDYIDFGLSEIEKDAIEMVCSQGNPYNKVRRHSLNKIKDHLCAMV